MDTYSEIKAVIAKIISIDPETITKEAHIHFDLGADSLGLENIAMALSEKYGIELLGEDTVELDNVGALVELVESRIKVRR